MDCAGLQALGSDTESFESDISKENIEESDNQKTDNVVSKANIESKQSILADRKKEAENLYEIYKKGLKYLASKEYEDAKNIFESILKNRLINEKFDDLPDIQKDLIKLKYILFKNLSQIYSKYLENYTSALEFLIQAAAIDGTDLNLWYEIGCTSLKTGKLIISKVAFEECLKINEQHWPSLDHIIILLFGIGNYSECLKHVIFALKIDKAYLNGLIILKKIQFLNDFFMTKEIELFVQTEYTDCGIEINDILEKSPEEYYDYLVERIKQVKVKSIDNLNKIKQIHQDINQNSVIDFPCNINSWKLLGNFVIDLVDEQKFNLFQKFTLIIKAKDAMLNENSLEKKNFENTNEENSNQSNKSNKRKHKLDMVNEEAWWKRRSLRKGNDKNDQAETTIMDILKNFFDENMLSDIKTIMTPTKKQSINENLISKNLISLEENERDKVQELINILTNTEICIFDIIKLYLYHVSLNFDKYWYDTLDDIYIKLYEILDEQIDLNEYLCDNRTNDCFSIFAPIITSYFDLKFSKYKLEMESQTSDDLNESFEQKNPKMEKLIYKLQEFEIQCETFYDNDFNNWIEKYHQNDQNKLYTLKSVLLRVFSLNLFVSCNFQYLDISSEYYNKKLIDLIDVNNQNVYVGISKIFKLINKDTIREFLKQNKKNNIFKMNSRIERFYKEENYECVISSLEDFAEIHKLPIDNPKFNSKIFVYFLKSFLKTTQSQKAKCGYFCRKFLKDCIHYLKDQLKNQPDIFHHEKNENNEENNEYESTINYISEITAFICDILEILSKIIPQLNSDSVMDANSFELQEEIESKNVINKENVWLMNQIISIYFDSNNDLALKLEIKTKPLKAFVILCDMMELKPENKAEIGEYLTLIHEYLARNGFCGSNNGEFLVWAIEKSIKSKIECELCSKNASTKIQELTDEDSNKSEKSASKSTDDESICCCAELDSLLEQCFFCLFGFKKKSARHLKNHSRIIQSFNSDNCWNVYYFYKPNKIPEYDGLAKLSLSTEINDLFTEILKIIKFDDQEQIEKCKSEFNQLLEACNFESIDHSLEIISKRYSLKEHEIKFKDIYYYLADYNFKNEKDDNKRELLVKNYYIKDLIINKDRFDSWASYALFQSSEILEEYAENSKSIKTENDFDKFSKSMNLSINLFKKSFQFKPPNDYKILVEFGLFIYQINSYISRLLRMNCLIGFLENDRIKLELEHIKANYMSMALDAYKQAYTSNQAEHDKHESESIQNDKVQPINIDESSATSSSSEKNQDKKNSKIIQNYEETSDEEWLQSYMIGKIKEKQRSNIFECLEHYKQAYESLDKNITVYLKKITYKSKSCLNLEANEMFYRIYALTLKNLEKLATKINNEEELNRLSNFLEGLVETRFVKAHNDFNLDEISLFLQENIFSNSEKLREIQQKDLFLNCICICVTGLCQILKRFSQHYRSMHRLAYFYVKFLDFQNLEIAKDLLLGNPKWNNLPYMPCPGLFQERNKSNFYNGIWKISSNTKEEQQDFERAGSFSNHLFKSTLLLIEVLEKSNDRTNLIEISKIFNQKLDPEKKYLNDDMLRKHISKMSLKSCFKVVEKTALESFKKTFNDMGEFFAYQNDLIPLLLDSYEIYKLNTDNEKLKKNCENHLKKMYVQFNPEALTRNTPLTLDEIIKYCNLIERKEKMNKPKTKPRNSLSQTSSANNFQ